MFHDKAERLEMAIMNVGGGLILSPLLPLFIDHFFVCQISLTSLF